MKLQCVIFHLQMMDYLRHKDLYGLVILFEDLVANSEAECKRFFDYIGISH
jgi:hypothetical protein